MNPISSESTSGLKAIADTKSCCGYGVCAEICPEVFKLDDNGIVTIPIALVPPEWHARAREAAAACPQSALRVEDA